MNLKYETKAIHAIVTNQLSDENAQMGMDDHNKNTMKKLITFLILLSFMTSCSIIQKTKKVDREKVEILEAEKTEISLQENSKLEESFHLHTENQLISLLSAINWQYAGKDSAEIEINSTETGIKIKVRGSGTANLATKAESKSERTDSILQKSEQIHQKINLKVNSEKEFKSEKKTLQKDKDVKRFDLSAWWWIIILILAVISLLLYWILGRPKKFRSKIS